MSVGEIIEDYPEDKYGPSCLIFGITDENRPIHIQCSYPSRQIVKVITVYEAEKLEMLTDKEVAYTVYKGGKFYIVENVPARVDAETGEQYFSPKTVENLHQIILGERKPVRTVQTPVFNFA